MFMFFFHIKHDRYSKILSPLMFYCILFPDFNKQDELPKCFDFDDVFLRFMRKYFKIIIILILLKMKLSI